MAFAIQSERLILPGEHVCDLSMRSLERPSRVILLLHGYLQSGEWILRKLSQSFPDDAWVIAPSAPYPIPHKSERGEGRYRVGYSWYFYDPLSDEYFIDMKIAVKSLRALLTRLGALAYPLTIVGYSQGGYLAPVLAQDLLYGEGPMARIDRIVGMSCQFLGEEFRIPLESQGKVVPMDAIHGELDETVSFAAARRSHEEILARGGKGAFVSLPGVEHRIVPEMIGALAEKLLVTGI